MTESKTGHDTGKLCHHCFSFVFWVTFMTAFSQPALAEGPMRIVYFEDYAPYSYKSGDNTKGLLIDIVDEILTHKLGIDVVHESYPWARAQKMVETGEADAFITSLNNRRLAYACAVEQPLLTNDVSVWVSKQSSNYKAIRSIQSVQDLSQYTVCEYIGYGLTDFVPAKRKVRIRNLEIALVHLASGRGDAIVDDSFVLEHNIKKLGLEPFIEKIQSSVFSTNFHLMVSQKSSFINSLSAINEELKKWIDSPRLHEMKSIYCNKFVRQQIARKLR